MVSRLLPVPHRWHCLSWKRIPQRKPSAASPWLCYAAARVHPQAAEHVPAFSTLFTSKSGALFIAQTLVQWLQGMTLHVVPFHLLPRLLVQPSMSPVTPDCCSSPRSTVSPPRLPAKHTDRPLVLYDKAIDININSFGSQSPCSRNSPFSAARSPWDR